MFLYLLTIPGLTVIAVLIVGITLMMIRGVESFTKAIKEKIWNK